jgi:hypothetical protein
MDEPCRGTLRFSGHWILTNVFVTQADILTSALSTKTYVEASPNAERSPTDSFSLLSLHKANHTFAYKVGFSTGWKKWRSNLIASAGCLVPAIVGARTLYQ